MAFFAFDALRYFSAQQSVVILNYGQKSVSEISTSISNRSSQLCLDCASMSPFISYMDFRREVLMSDRKLYIMTISPSEGTVCCLTCLSSCRLSVQISYKLSDISLSISSLRILNIQLFLIEYLSFLSSALLFFISFTCNSQAAPLSWMSDMIFFFSLAFFRAEVLARKIQSLSFILLAELEFSTFLSRLVDMAELEISYSSCSCCEKASFWVLLWSQLGVKMLIASFAFGLCGLFSFYCLLMEICDFMQ